VDRSKYIGLTFELYEAVKAFDHAVEHGSQDEIHAARIAMLALEDQVAAETQAVRAALPPDRRKALEDGDPDADTTEEWEKA
jgi:hypothetical protein